MFSVKYESAGQFRTRSSLQDLSTVGDRRNTEHLIHTLMVDRRKAGV